MLYRRGCLVADEEDEAGPDEAVGRELLDAASQILARHDLMVTKWLFVADVIDGDGERMLASYASPDIRAWDTLGMIDFVQARERGVVAADAAAEFGD